MNFNRWDSHSSKRYRESGDYIPRIWVDFDCQLIIFCPQDDSNKMFILFDFVKDAGGGGGLKNSDKKNSKKNKKKKSDSLDDAKDSESTTGEALLKPCIYKRR